MSYILSSSYLKKEFIETSTSDKQDLTTDFSAVNGSTITYTPYDNAGTQVLYEYTTAWAYKDNQSKIIFRLVEYNSVTSSWDEITGSYATIKNKMKGTGLINYKYVLQKWSGSKQLRLECKDSTSSLEGYLHSNYSQTNYYDPVVECTTI